MVVISMPLLAGPSAAAVAVIIPLVDLSSDAGTSVYYITDVYGLWI